MNAFATEISLETVEGALREAPVGAVLALHDASVRGIKLSANIK